MNHVALRTLLSGVMVHIMENPGITRDMMIQKYGKYLQPVPLFELIEVTFCSREVTGTVLNCLYLDYLICRRGSKGGVPGAPPLIFERQKILKNSFTLICNFTHKRLCKIYVSGSLIVSSTQFL